MHKFFVEIQNPAMATYRITEAVPKQFNHFYGFMLLSPFLALLPGEQLAYGIVLKEMFALEFEGGGFTPSLVGGFYMDFGMPAVSMGLLAYGFILGRLFRRMNTNMTPYNIIIYSYVTVYFVNTIRGGFLQEILPIWYLLILYTLRKFFERYRRI